MDTACLIFPHQLYHPHPASRPDRLHLLIEEPLFFGDARYPARFHVLKLAYHRACLRRYHDEALAGLARRYVAYGALADDPCAYLVGLAEQGIHEVHVCDPTDFILERRLRRACTRLGLALVWHESPNFLTTPAQIDAFYATRKRPDDYHQTDFYIHQRKRLGLLLDERGRPLGGQWTYDADNRRKLPAQQALPPAPTARYDDYWQEAFAYVRAHFPHNPGQLLPTSALYATSPQQARADLHDFLAQRLSLFGPYQDALSARSDTLFHSLLSAPLNVGLLSPQEVVQAALASSAADATPLASLEGFLRQVVGWREFMRAVYLRVGVRQRTSNFFHQSRPLGAAWYEGRLGLPLMDDLIHKLNRLAYGHHIERLMLAGNLMLLCEIHPDEVYRWFMELFIDAYDWVMVPNVYGMSQFADGGLITTKPYISSSNYLLKMSDARRGPWCAVWDGLYWRFVAQHEAFFRANPRLAMMTGHLDRMGEEGLRQHRQRAEAFLAQL